jgi:hypothetical protein
MKPNSELKRKIQFLKLLDQARQKMNWTVAKLDHNLYIVGKKEQVKFCLEVLDSPEEEAAPVVPEIPETGEAC